MRALYVWEHEGLLLSPFLSEPWLAQSCQNNTYCGLSELTHPTLAFSCHLDIFWHKIWSFFENAVEKKTWKSNGAQMRRKLQWSPHLLFGPSTLFRSNQILQCALIAFSIWSKQGWAILPTWLLVTQSKTFNTWATCMMGPMVVDFQHWIT